jgi:hypothetical protein
MVDTQGGLSENPSSKKKIIIDFLEEWLNYIEYTIRLGVVRKSILEIIQHLEGLISVFDGSIFFPILLP